MPRHLGPIAGISCFCPQLCISFLPMPVVRFPLDFLSPAVLHLLSESCQWQSRSAFPSCTGFDCHFCMICCSSLCMTYSTSSQISICWCCNPASTTFHDGTTEDWKFVPPQPMLQTNQDVCGLYTLALWEQVSVWISFNTQEAAEEVFVEIMWCWITRLTQSCVNIHRLQEFYRSVAQLWLLEGRKFIRVIREGISHLNVMKWAEGRILCDSQN